MADGLRDSPHQLALRRPLPDPAEARLGGMANVYLAEDEKLGRRVAIKILNERYAGDDLFIERFRREAKSAAGLYPNIVSIYDRGEAEARTTSPWR